MDRLILEPEEETFVLENEWDTAIPLSFTYTPERGTILHAFPAVEGVARAFLATYGDDPTSDEALAFLFDGVAPFFEKWGYEDDRFRDRWGYILRAQAAKELPFSDKAVLLSAEDEEGNQTTYDLAATAEAGCLAYGIKEEGRVVSLAVTHEAPEEAGEAVEVGVETIPSARRKGYASACLSVLTKDLLSRGLTVEYRCQRYNAASRRTAESAGFLPVGKYYFYVGRRKNGL